jgi:Spy/CpxP family protein refolding chaperone
MGRGGGLHGRHGGRGDFMAKLDLSARQKEQIQGIRQEQQRRMIQMRADIQKASLDLREMMRSENPNRSRIDAAIDRLAGLRADAHKARVATHLEVRSVLTEEQRRKLREPSTERGSHRPRGQRRPGGDAGKS